MGKVHGVDKQKGIKCRGIYAHFQSATMKDGAAEGGREQTEVRKG